MSEHSMPLQDLPCLSPRGSVLSQARRTCKRRSRGCLGEGLEMECTPTELIQQWSPLHKHQRLASKGKENDGGQFVLARRSRRKREAASSDVSWDHLPDELLLRVLFYVPLKDLLRMSTVCQRWRRIALDESLWHSVDLEGLTHTGPALQQVLKTGVRMLRCPRSFVEELHFTGTGPLQIVVMDLSSSIIPTASLESIMCHCRQLEYLSLEGLQLSDNIVSSLSKNPNLLQLNLSGCSGFSAAALGDMLASCSSVEQLNIAWCDFSNDHVKSVVGCVSARLTHLNLSGYREGLTLDDVKILVTRCPHIQTLDLSDSTLLMADCFPVLKPLADLLHLSLSRCYHIHLAALTDLDTTFPGLSLLDAFGIVSGSHLSSLKKEMPRVAINSRPFSGVARPTPASGPLAHFMWGRKCRLRVQQ
ncbi:S-phase kinase-associated protein 2 isoform X1 [Gasterosteus aculeatus]|uniref:LOW QUALITY PROTEIN: S-phase kinase-associated protein 2-like n=1 Tax=Gasterosteus aculeatus aculeatus TaxID=481459 RepID=UPI001A97EBFC|nr:LOW QUALITY PROTEIN: S-phase kinase-associated protein 2-like [Gasterosteus aculeatus aculeatus]